MTEWMGGARKSHSLKVVSWDREEEGGGRGGGEEGERMVTFSYWIEKRRAESERGRKLSGIRVDRTAVHPSNGCIHTHMHTHTVTVTHTYTHTRTHAHTYTCTHTHTCEEVTTSCCVGWAHT